MSSELHEVPAEVSRERLLDLELNRALPFLQKCHPKGRRVSFGTFGVANACADVAELVERLSRVAELAAALHDSDGDARHDPEFAPRLRLRLDELRALGWKC